MQKIAVQLSKNVPIFAHAQCLTAVFVVSNSGTKNVIIFLNLECKIPYPLVMAVTCQKLTGWAQEGGGEGGTVICILPHLAFSNVFLKFSSLSP